MADVLQKIIDASDFKNGDAIVSADKLGNYDVLTPTNNQTLQITIQSGLLDSRFDDVGYYTVYI